jgi:signal transduction histidine kinase/CheY-like chemotaxis protein
VSLRLLTVVVENEHDVVVARQRSSQIAGLLGFETQDQTRIATAVSEITRNCVRYARGGRAEFAVEGSTQPQVLLIRITDTGPGIQDVDAILRGTYRSTTGMGIGISGARRLVDGFEIGSSPGGTRVVLKKLLPRGAPLVNGPAAARIASELMQIPARDAYAEVQRQNQELLRTLEDLRQRQDELLRLNHELQDTNRGVLALYAELDERADHLRRADELKTRFLSNMSHEFRTPLNSTLALTRLLLDRLDGPLTGEQERQVQLIRTSAMQLLELVNDLLDLAKVQAGKIVVRPAEFHVADLFGALRGMLRPLLVSDQVELAIDAPGDLPPLHTDEGKVSQILRNLLSNALKFTERGEVRVTAGLSGDRTRVRFAVRDTGIGIAAEDQARIFEEFGQLEHPIQERVRGTGLGLPLSRRLAHLLGGTLTVESRPGAGSTFTLELPRTYTAVAGGAEPVFQPRAGAEAEARLDRRRIPVLVIEDEEGERLAYEAFLRDTRFQVLLAQDLREARVLLRRFVPGAIVLDISLGGEDSWQFLAQLKASETFQTVPVLVATAVDDERKALALGADGYLAKPLDPVRLTRELGRLTGHSPERARRVLVVDDDPAFRYSMRRALEHLGCAVDEAASGTEGLAHARRTPPELVLLDLQMPMESGDGEAVLEGLRTTPETAAVPVVLVSARDAATGRRIEESGAALFVDKQLLSPAVLETLLRGGERSSGSMLVEVAP